MKKRLRARQRAPRPAKVRAAGRKGGAREPCAPRRGGDGVAEVNQESSEGLEKRRIREKNGGKSAERVGDGRGVGERGGRREVE